MNGKGYVNCSESRVAHHHGFDGMNHHLYLSAFSMCRFLMKNESHSDSRLRGKPFSSFMMVLRGEVTIETENEVLRGKAGDMFYMPDGLRYMSHWKGSPEIEFVANYCRFQTLIPKEGDFAMTPEIVPGLPFDRQFALQKIDRLSNEKTRREFIWAWEQSQLDETGQMKAMAYLYQLYAENIPYLKKQKTEAIPSVLLPAVVCMTKDYMHNDPISVYAGMCHLSESRFFHLFRQTMHTTPVDFRNKLRIQYAALILTSTDSSIEDISQTLGFESSDYFRRVFKSIQGVSPSQYRRSQNGITL